MGRWQSIILLCILATPLAHACITPIGDDTLVNESTTLCTGTYYLNDTNNNGLFNIANGTTLDCNGSTFIGDTNGYGIRLTGQSNITAINCTFQAYRNGLNVLGYNSTFNHITTNNGLTGVYFDYGTGNRFTNITTDDNLKGVYVGDGSTNNLFSAITAHNNTDFGLFIVSSARNNRFENIVTAENNIGIRLDSNNNNIMNATIDQSSSQGLLIQGNNNSIGNITVTNSNYGVYVQNGDNNTFDNITANNNQQGIYLQEVIRNNFTRTIVVGNTIAGINIQSTTLNANNSLIDVTATNNAVGINIIGSAVLAGGYLALINANNNQQGIVISRGGNIIMLNSTITNNSIIGFDSFGSTNNTIYNNFFNNTQNAWDNGTGKYNTTLQTGTNIVGGSKLGGNFWATPAGDGCSQRLYDANGDGVSDTGTCAIAGGSNVDYLPLTLFPTQSAQTNITAPSNNTFGRQNVSVNLTFNNTARIIVTSINSTGGGAVVASANSVHGPYNLTWNTLNSTDGVYNLSVLVIDAYDATNNVTLTASNLTIDNTPPNITLIWPTNETTRIPFTSSRIKIIPAGRFTIFQLNTTYNLTEENIVGYYCRIGAMVSNSFESPNGMQNMGVSTNGVGDYIVTSLGAPQVAAEGVYCVDAAGNAAEIDTRWIYMDSTAPTMVLYNPANTTNSYGGLNLTITEWNPADTLLRYNLTGSSNRTGSIPVSSFAPSNNATINMNWVGDYGLSHLPTASHNISSKYSFANTTFFDNLPNGAYTLTLTAADSLNSNGTKTLNFTVNDTTPPRIVLNGPSSAQASTVITFNISINESYPNATILRYALLNSTAGIVAQASIYTNQTTTADNITWRYSATIMNLSDDNYTLQATAYDMQGNGNTTNTTFTIDTAPPAWTTRIRNIEYDGATIETEGMENITYNMTLNSSYNTIATGYNTSTRFKNLLPDTSYRYTIIGCDALDNCATSDGTFMTEHEPSKNSGGAGNPATSLTTPEEMTTPTTTKLAVNSVYNFKRRDERHKITVRSIDTDTVTLTIQSTPQTITLANNTPKDIDLDNDTINDITIIATIIKNNVLLNITPIEPAPTTATENTTGQPTTPTNNAAPSPTAGNQETAQPPAQLDVQNETKQDAATPSAVSWAFFGLVAVIALILIIVKMNGKKL